DVTALFVDREAAARAGVRHVTEQLHRAAAGEVLTDAELLRLAVWMGVGDARDAVWEVLTPGNARRLLDVWARAARLAPDAWRPGALAMAGLCAWRIGDGARCHVAIELALGHDRRHPLAGL